jgi:galactokinase
MDLTVVVINSRVHHDLAANAYNERRRQCEQAVAFFAGQIPGVRALRDVATWQWEKFQKQMDPLTAQRSQHVVTEIERTQIAVEALLAGDPATVGRCMNASHDSLRDQYEVSCRELDLLVDIARTAPGVYGSRMTGGGFGGCTVTLCRRGAVEGLRRAVQDRYHRETGLEPDVLVTGAAGAARLEWSIA